MSHSVYDGLVTYPGLPAPRIDAFFDHEGSRGRYAEGTEFHIARIEMVANTGTYLDTPFHRYRDGGDLAELPLASVANLPGVVVAARGSGLAARADELPAGDLAGHAVLFRTGWSRHFGTPAYLAGHPYLGAELADELVQRRVALVGIDSLNIDATSDGSRPVHSALLRAGIPIVEHLTALAELPASGFRFFAVPVKVRGMGTFPVRAFALV